MINPIAKDRMTAQLPPVRCTPELREMLEARAKRWGTRPAEVVRAALADWLRAWDASDETGTEGVTEGTRNE